MRLKSLYLSRQSYYGENPDQLTGKIELQDPNGEVSIVLTVEACEEIVKLVAKGAVQAVERSVEALLSSCLDDGAKLLESNLCQQAVIKKDSNSDDISFPF